MDRPSSPISTTALRRAYRWTIGLALVTGAVCALISIRAPDAGSSSASGGAQRVMPMLLVLA